MAATQARGPAFLRPEILAIPSEKMEEFLQSSATALQASAGTHRPQAAHARPQGREAAGHAVGDGRGGSQVFRQLTNADMKFGEVKNEKGQTIELSHASFISLLSANAEVRHGVPRLLRAIRRPPVHAGRVAQRVHAARRVLCPGALSVLVGGGPVSDVVPVSVDNLIASVHRQLPRLYRYYGLRRRVDTGTAPVRHLRAALA